MYEKIRLIPYVTTNQIEFLYIVDILTEGYYDEVEQIVKMENLKAFISSTEAIYFEGVIYAEKLNFYFILHEFAHHITRLLRGFTRSRFWHKMDYIIDTIDVMVF
jgi:hypothetical protein